MTALTLCDRCGGALDQREPRIVQDGMVFHRECLPQPPPAHCEACALAEEQGWPRPHGREECKHGSLARKCELCEEIERADRAEEALREIRARLRLLADTVSGDGQRNWYWCCRAEYVVGEPNTHREDCFMEGPEGLHNLVRAALAALE